MRPEQVLGEENREQKTRPSSDSFYSIFYISFAVKMQGTLNYSNLPLFELYITLDVFIKKSVKMGLYGGYGNHDFSPSLRPLG